MAVFLAYVLVVLIWATTPLAIQWSSDSISFIAAALSRMMMAVAFALPILFALRRRLFPPGAWKVYLAGSIGIFPNMPVVYWSAQFIPSGLVAVIFAMSPFVTGVLSLLILRENPFTMRRVLALIMALAGLSVIFYGQLRIDHQGLYGIAGILLSCVLFSFSSVLMKRLNENTEAFAQMTGSLLFSLPGLVFTWWLLDGQLPIDVSDKTLGGVVYLAIFGSLVGYTLFFFILKRLSASVVSLVTLMTPLLALLLGVWIADERFTFQLLLGVGMVILALLLYIEIGLVRLCKVCFGALSRLWSASLSRQPPVRLP
ncbi:MAG TPA: DMT family transporter [Cellvibrio sp.]|nr:DMT family transporter [Cellvibrio sp.]